jgi:mannose-6-phosphate isomerase-like protein (cupin superfamily)
MTPRAIVLHDSAVPLERWSDPVRGEVGFRTLFGGDATATSSLTAGIGEMEPGDWLGHHRHAPAEIYYVIAGEGVVHLGEEQQAVRAGSAVFIPGNLEHGIRNTGSEPLRMFYAFAVDAFADIEYRFSAEPS